MMSPSATAGTVAASRGVSLLCATAHAIVLGLSGAAALATTAPMLGLSLVCAGCSLGGHHRRWLAPAGAAAAVLMVALHLVMSHPADHAMAGMDMGSPSAELLMRFGLLLAVIQVGLLGVLARPEGARG